MIAAWLAIRIDASLPTSGSRGLRRRTLLVPPGRTFGQLAESINLALARWDPDGAHEFVLADGRRVGPVANDPAVLDERVMSVGEVLNEGDEFTYQLDSVALRRCRVLATNLEKGADTLGAQRRGLE